MDAMPRRPAGASDETVEAVGTLSEALEYLVRARGHLYSLHQLLGRVDLLTGQAAEQLAAQGHAEQARLLQEEVVGRNVLPGRWTFQVVEEFDETYYRPFERAEQAVRDALMAGVRHVHEAEMKAQRRTAGRPGHEWTPDEA